MKKIFSILFYVLCFFLTSFGAPKVENMVYIFNQLTTYSDEKSMDKYCENYSLYPISDEADTHTYSCPDGSVISFKVEQTDTGRKLPVVEMTTPMKHKEIDSTLKSLGYVKEGSSYVKGKKHHPTQTVCTISKEDSSCKLRATKHLNR